jgi:hypothetical protein
MPSTSQLSPRGAIVVGLLFIVVGVIPILIGVGVLTPTNVPDPAPPWVIVAAGLLFVAAGFAVILDFGIAGGIGPDGDFAPDTPVAIRTANLALGLTIVGLLGAVAGWVAFGAGPRQFTTTLSLPFLGPHRSRGGELSGRIAFGAMAVVLAILFVASGVVGVRRLLAATRARSGRSSAPGVTLRARADHADTP